MASEAISEHLTSKNFLGEHALRSTYALHAYTYTPDTMPDLRTETHAGIHCEMSHGDYLFTTSTTENHDSKLQQDECTSVVVQVHDLHHNLSISSKTLTCKNHSKCL